MRQAEQEQQESWLLSELCCAGEQQDAPALRQLMTEASGLDLPVPPGVRALVDELEDGARPFASTMSSTTSSRGDVTERLAAMQGRQPGTEPRETVGDAEKVIRNLISVAKKGRKRHQLGPIFKDIGQETPRNSCFFLHVF